MDPLALASVLAHARLEQAGIDPAGDLTLIAATPGHNASLLSCYRGTTDAAARIRPLCLRARPEIRGNTRIVAETARVPHMPIAVAPRVNENIARQLRDILVNMATDPQGRTLLRHLDWPGFVAVQPGEYDGLGLVADKPGVEQHNAGPPFRSLRVRLIAGVVVIEIVMLSLLVWNNLGVIRQAHAERLWNTAAGMLDLVATGRVQTVDSTVAGNPTVPAPVSAIDPALIQLPEGAGPRFFGGLSGIGDRDADD
ncbi:MAG: phosphate/phosphite/phosphonate ABC transporter substrate-binding protein [Thiogranum sp.]